MKINLRRYDIILIAGLIIIYLVMLAVESFSGQNIHGYISTLLVLIFVTVYLNTIRSLEIEFKKVKLASRREILENIDGVERKIEKALPSLETKEEDLRKLLSKVDEHIVREIKNVADNLYFQIDSLISINKVLEEVRYPMPPFRGWSISPDFGRYVMSYILKLQPNVVFDLGSGVTSVVSGHCMKINGKGKVISLDHEEQYYSLTRDYIKFHRLDKFVDVIYAPLKKYMINGHEYQWYDINLDFLRNPADLIIVDGPPGIIQHESRYPAVPLLLNYMNDGCIILVDDYSREDEKEITGKWVDEFGLKIISFEKTEKGFCALRYRKPENHN